MFNLEIDDVNISLKVMKKKLHQSASIVKNTSENLYEYVFEIEQQKSLILREKL